MIKKNSSVKWFCYSQKGVEINDPAKNNMMHNLVVLIITFAYNLQNEKNHIYHTDLSNQV